MMSSFQVQERGFRPTAGAFGREILNIVSLLLHTAAGGVSRGVCVMKRAADLPGFARSWGMQNIIPLFHFGALPNPTGPGQGNK